MNRSECDINEDEYCNKSLEYVFIFKNTGDEPLKLTKVKAGCGCKIPSWSTGLIYPKDNGFVKVTCNINRCRSLTKTITVKSNAENDLVRLKVKVNIIPDKNKETNISRTKKKEKKLTDIDNENQKRKTDISRNNTKKLPDINKYLTTKEAFKLIDDNVKNKDFVIIDVRTTEEFEKEHIKNAINLDYDSPKFKKHLSVLDKNKIYLLYCKKGTKSAESLYIMNELGFEKVYDLLLGIEGWKECSYPLEKYKN